MIYITEKTLLIIASDIAAHAPERGGALMGPVGIPAVTRFVFDPSAETTSVTYSPSLELISQVPELERSQNLEFKGIIHSHPGNMDHPSGQDERELQVGLDLNPQMPLYLAPIVTLPKPDKLQDHETKLGSGKVSFFAAHRARGGMRLLPMPVEVITEEELSQMIPPKIKTKSKGAIEMKQDIKNLHTKLGGAEPEFFSTTLEGAAMMAGKLVMDDGMELLFVCGHSYPVAPPLLLVTPRDGDTEQVPLPWSLETPAETRLQEAVLPIFSEGGPLVKAFGTPNGLVLGNQPEQAKIAGWIPRYAGKSTLDRSLEVQGEVFARVRGVLSSDIRYKNVLISGLGSVGSYIAEQLARSGVGRMVLIDPETVEPANLSRTVYEVGDVDRAKTEALARRLWNINPALELTLHAKTIQDFNAPELEQVIEGADLVLATTDDLAAQRALNRFAYAKKKPAIFVGMYAGAHGGEVILSLPEHTPCYQCATSTRHEMEQETATVSAATDYGTGRLTGEIALSADIQHVSSAAVKMALALLTPYSAEANIKTFLDRAIENQMTYLTLSTVPDYWFYPAIFGETSGQYAYQSIWLTPTRRTDCAVCGDQEHRESPTETPLRAPALGDLRNASAREEEFIEGEIAEV